MLIPDFPGDSVGKESACNAGVLGSIPGMGRSPGEGNGYPLQYTGLENSKSPWGRKELDMTEQLSLHKPVAGGFQSNPGTAVEARCMPPS